MNESLTTTTIPLHDFVTVTCQVVMPKQLLCYDNLTYLELDEDRVGTAPFYIDLGISIALLVVAGLISGLTVGVMTLDPMYIEVVRKSGSSSARRQAASVAPLVKRHHLLLVSLLLLNAAAAEALPIFLDRLVGPIIAVVVSVSGVLIFGEIIPQAVCTRYGLEISSRLSWLIWFLIFLVFPISYPVSALLDCVLGHDTTTFYRRSELKHLIGMHAESGSNRTENDHESISVEVDNDSHESEREHALTADEANVIRAAIDLSSKTVADVMTPIDDVFMLDETTALTRAVMEVLVARGFSRVPIYRVDRNHIIGVMLMKQLILLRPDDGTPIAALPLRAMPIVPSTLDCYGALDMFQLGRSHIAIVVDAEDTMTLLGCVTLEDIIEELLNEEIADESGAMVVQNRGRVVASVRRLSQSGAWTRSGSVSNSYNEPARLHLTRSGSIAEGSDVIRATINHMEADRSRSTAQTRFRRNLDERRPLLRASQPLERHLHPPE